MTEAQILRKLAKRDRLAAELRQCDQELNAANLEYWRSQGYYAGVPRPEALRKMGVQ